MLRKLAYTILVAMAVNGCYSAPYHYDTYYRDHYHPWYHHGRHYEGDRN